MNSVFFHGYGVTKSEIYHIRPDVAFTFLKWW